MSNQDTKTKRLTIIATALLGLIAILTAWSSFQSTKWNGQMSIDYAAAGTARTNSSKAALTANQETLLDVQLFVDWVNAKRNEDEDLAQFYFERMRSEAKAAIEAWLATDPLNSPDAPSSPFVMPEYKQESRLKATDLEEKADELVEKARESNQNGDNYVATTVILAMGLFFAGIATQLDSFRLKMAVILMAVAAMAFGIYNIATYPYLY